MDPSDIFRKNVEIEFELRSLRQVDVADAIGELPQKLNDYLKGRINWGEAKRKKLADYLEVEYHVLCDDQLHADILEKLKTKGTPLTLEQHRETGRQMKQVLLAYDQSLKAVHWAYPNTIAKTYDAVRRKLKQLISKLEDQLLEEHPEIDVSLLGKIYRGDISKKQTTYQSDTVVDNGNVLIAEADDLEDMDMSSEWLIGLADDLRAVIKKQQERIDELENRTEKEIKNPQIGAPAQK